MTRGAEAAQGSRFIDRLNTDASLRLILWLFGAVLLVFGAIPIINLLLGESLKDYKLWYETGQQIINGEAIYPTRNQKFPFMYPPACALFLAPISLLGQAGLLATLVLVNAAAWVASIVLAVRLATGTWARPHLLIYVVPSLLIVVYAWSNFHLGQPSLVLLALILGAFVALQTRRQALAGILIAIAAAIKAFPFILIVYLVYRRYWWATASLLVSLAFLLLVLPAPFRGWDQARADLQRWTEGMLLKYDDTGIAQRPGRSNSWKNQSIFGVANRLLRHVDADDQFAHHTPVYVNVADLSFTTVNKIIVGLALLFGGVYIAVLPRRRRRTAETDAIEFALLVLLILIFTPLAFGYLFACLLYPFTVVVRQLLARENRALCGAAAAAVLLLLLTIPFQRTAQAYGNTMLATMILFAALSFELWRIKRQPAAAAIAANS